MSKPAIQLAAEMYAERGLTLAHDLENYLKFGYVFCTPERIMLAREIKKDDEKQSWLAHGEGDTWMVHLAVGADINWFINQAPYAKKWVAWAREFKNSPKSMKFYDFNRIKTLTA